MRRLVAALAVLPMVMAAVPATAAEAAPLQRAVCDGRNQSARAWLCGVDYKPVRVEGGAATGVKDVDSAYTWMGQLQTFYGNVGADFQEMLATDVNGKRAVNVTVRACQSSCERNAWPTYYTRKHVVISTSMLADDVVGHEFAHGVQDYFGKMATTEGEAGDVREGVADIVGELFDLTNGDSDDNTNRWKMGEGSPYGIFRHMDNPNLRKMPDTKGGQYWDTSGSSGINAAVVEKAGYLISEGETFNGQTITGIGTTKSIALWFGTLKQQPQNATFKQLASTLKSVCAANAQNGVAGTTTTDCDQVAKAITATKLDS